MFFKFKVVHWFCSHFFFSYLAIVSIHRSFQVSLNQTQSLCSCSADAGQRCVNIATSVFCSVHTKVEWCLGNPLQLDWEQMEPTTGIKSGLMLLGSSWAPPSDRTPAPPGTSWICWQSKTNWKGWILLQGLVFYILGQIKKLLVYLDFIAA